VNGMPAEANVAASPPGPLALVASFPIVRAQPADKQLCSFSPPRRWENRRIHSMGNETRWRRPSVSSQDPPSENRDLHFAHPEIYIEETMGDRPVLCDCHCGPMYYLAVSLMPRRDFVMCWVSDCGRCYNKSLGYFHLRTTRPTLERIDEDTRSMALCPNENCSTCSSMAITRSDDTSSGEGKPCWHCFDCGTEFPHHKVRGLLERLLRSSRPSIC
jgi:hypothetical protein